MLVSILIICRIFINKHLYLIIKMRMERKTQKLAGRLCSHGVSLVKLGDLKGLVFRHRKLRKLGKNTINAVITIY